MGDLGESKVRERHRPKPEVQRQRNKWPMGSGGRKLTYIYGDPLCASTTSILGTSEPAVNKQTKKDEIFKECPF